jgi:hypothetical protein
MSNSTNTASIVDLMQWMVDKINESTWSFPLTAERTYLHLMPLEELEGETALIRVFPSTSSSEFAGCNVLEEQIISFQSLVKGKPNDIAPQDKAVKLCEEIRDYFSDASRTRQIDTNDVIKSFDVYEAQLDPTLDKDAMSEFNLYTSQVGMRFKIKRKVSS